MAQQNNAPAELEANIWGVPGIDPSSKTKLEAVPAVDLFPTVAGQAQRNEAAKKFYNSALERTVPVNQEAENAGASFTPQPRGDLKPEKYYAIDPIYAKNLSIYKNMGQRIHGFERAQRKAFIKRQITADLSKSENWAHVIRKARAYRFALFKEQAARKAKQYDREIKNIQMKQALAIHNMEFKVDPPLITAGDIGGIVGELGSGIKGTMTIKDAALSDDSVKGIPIDQHSDTSGLFAFQAPTGPGAQAAN